MEKIEEILIKVEPVELDEEEKEITKREEIVLIEVEVAKQDKVNLEGKEIKEANIKEEFAYHDSYSEDTEEGPSSYKTAPHHLFGDLGKIPDNISSNEANISESEFLNNMEGEHILTASSKCDDLQDKILMEKSFQKNIGLVSANTNFYGAYLQLPVCTLCQKSFNSKGNLNKHLLIHTDEKMFVCEICRKSFLRKDCLVRHMLRHSDVTHYSCEICETPFKRKEYLTKHMFCHTEERNFTCELCNNSFKRKNDLKQHMLSHSDEKHCICKICHKSFKKPSYLTRHMLCHSNEKQFRCEICHKSLKRKYDLGRHMLSHSNT